MPSTSAKQAKFMRAVAHSPKFAKKVGVPQSVGKDYEMADKKKMKFGDGGDTARAKKLKGPGPARPLEFPIRGSSISIPLDEPKPTPRKIPPKITKTAPATPVDRDEARKYREELKKVKVSPAEGRVIESANRSEGGGHKKGGMIMKKSDKAGRALVKKSADTMGRAMVKKAGGGKCYAKGGSIDGVAQRGKTKGKQVKMAGGGLTLGNRMMTDTGSGMRASSGPVTLGNNRMVDTGNGRMLSLGGMKPGQSITNSRPTMAAPGRTLGGNLGTFLPARKPTGMKKGGMTSKKKGGKC